MSLPVLAQPEVAGCCAPLQSEPLDLEQATDLARRFAALSDPVRLRLLSLLASSSSAVCACDLVEPVGKSQPTVSHHLKVLREAGLITSEKRGVNIWYAAVPAGLELLRLALRDSGSPWGSAVDVVTSTLPKLRGDEMDAVRRLADAVRTAESARRPR